MLKYGVKVPLDGVMLFVTEGDSKFRLRIKTFDSIDEAWEHASLWGDDAIVVELNDDYEVAL